MTVESFDRGLPAEPYSFTNGDGTSYRFDRKRVRFSCLPPAIDPVPHRSPSGEASGSGPRELESVAKGRRRCLRKIAFGCHLARILVS